MKRKIKSICINTPCKKEEWSSMTPKGKDRLCKSCDTIVVDFENFSDQEIIEYFEKRIFQKTCGRFSNKQLTNLNLSISKQSTSSPLNWIKAFLFAASVSIVACNPSKRLTPSDDKHYSVEAKPIIKIIKDIVHPASDNSTIIKGHIRDETNEPYAFATIQYGATGLGTNADIDGNFELIIPNDKISGDDFIVKMIGCKDVVLKFDEVKNKEIEVVLFSEDVHIIIGMIDVN